MTCFGDGGDPPFFPEKHQRGVSHQDVLSMNTTHKGRILLAEPDTQLAKLFQVILNRDGYQVEWESDGHGAIRAAVGGDFDLMLLNLELPPTGGIHTLQEVKKAAPRTLVVVCTANPCVENAVQALKSGAYDYMEQPLGQKALLDLAQQAMELQAKGAERRLAREELQAEQRRSHELAARVRQQGVEEHLLGTSAAMRSLQDIIREVAGTDSTVLLFGESGTGKGLVARAIHDCSPREDQPLVVANCTLYSEGVLHSELFGHEKGAFTGAIREKSGRFELAAGGTIFLDEIGDLPAPTQALLLRVLQERRFERVGGEKSLAMRARVIAATHRDLRNRIDRCRG
jgi:DNA-binding NtrC family response regulator